MKQFVIFDLEYTFSWDDPSFDKKEIIQIAAIKVDAKTFQVLDSIKMLVKPTLNPIVPQCLIDYTGITQEQVDKKGKTFREAYAEFRDFATDLVCFTHGWRDGFNSLGDGNILNNGLKYNDMVDENLPYYVNIAGWFKDRYAEDKIDIKKQTSGQIAKLLGVDKNIEHLGLKMHDALYDVHSILEGIKYFDAKGLCEFVKLKIKAQ